MSSSDLPGFAHCGDVWSGGRRKKYGGQVATDLLTSWQGGRRSDGMGEGREVGESSGLFVQPDGCQIHTPIKYNIEK